MTTSTILRVCAAIGIAGLVSQMSLPAEAASAPMAAVERLAMVDLQRVLNETKAGKAARSGLEGSLKAKQGQLDKKRTELEGEAAKLRNLKGQKLVQAQEKLQLESVEWQKTAMALEQDLAEQEGKLLDTIYSNAQKIVAKLAEEHKLDMVIVRDQMTVIYVDPNLDVTDEVIRRYDKAHPK